MELKPCMRFTASASVGLLIVPYGIETEFEGSYT